MSVVSGFMGIIPKPLDLFPVGWVDVRVSGRKPIIPVMGFAIVSVYNDLTLADYFNEEVRHLFLMLDEHRFDPGKTLHTNGPAQ